ncbi:MAG: electron transport complex subunit RsxG [Cocleimonas sp.]|nr:electron transport complex subunit RsxG [Cocleimonas sp.]
MKKSIIAMQKSGLLLAFFALLGVVFVSVSHLLTKDQIAANQRDRLQQKWNEVLAASLYRNDLNTDYQIVTADEINLPKDATVYLARDEKGTPIAAIFRVTTLNGYSGAITVLVSVRYADKKITGVRVVKHKETPGLGDKIEVAKSNWILSFDNKGLSDTNSTSWTVKKDGGEFDQFTGATITPRAVVELVKQVLIYANHNLPQLFAKPHRKSQSSKKKAE